MLALGVVPDAVRAYGAMAQGVGVAVASAGAMDASALVTEVALAIGPVAPEFTATFAQALANNMASVAELSAVHLATNATALATSAAYEAADALGAL